MPQSACPVSENGHGIFMNAITFHGFHNGYFGADPAVQPVDARIVAAVEEDAIDGERAQRVPVETEAAGTKCAHPTAPSLTDEVHSRLDQDDLLFQRKVPQKLLLATNIIE